MFEKLLELLLTAKAGAISGVLILAGALVSVSTSNGVTTITIDQPTPTPTATATATPTPTPTATPAATETVSPTPTPSATASPEETETSCAANAQALAAAVQSVREAYVQDHTGLMKLRGGEEGRFNGSLHQADQMLREIVKKTDQEMRQIACPKVAEQNEDQNENDEDSDENASASPTPAPSSSPTDVTTQLNDLATQAIAAMQTVYSAAQALVANASPTPSASPFGEHAEHHGTPQPSDHD